MDRVKVLAVAPYSEMRDIMESLIAGREDMALTVHVAPMEAGADFVKNCDQSEYDVIISRGGTAELISQVTDLPVVSVPLSPYDIQNALSRAGDPSKHLAVVGFSEITTAAAALCDILNLEVEITTIHDSSEAPAVIEDLKHRGVEKILSDTVGTQAAKAVGMDATLITSGPVSIEDALNKAASYFSTQGRLRFANSLFMAELESSNCIVVAMSTDGKVVFSAPELTVTPSMRSTLQHILPYAIRDGGRTLTRSVGSRDYSISATRIIIEDNPYIFFRLYCRGKKLPFTIPGVEFYDSAEKDLNYIRLYYGSDSGSEAVNKIKHLANTGLPLLIQGPSGSGTNEMAGVMAMKNSLMDRSCIVVHCKKLDSHGWSKLLGDSGLLSCDPGQTVIFRQCFSMPDTQYRALIEFLADSAMRRQLRLIFTADIGNCKNALERRNLFIDNLFGCYCTLPSLSERRDDMPELISACLNSVCASLGARSASIEPAAVSLLADFNWRDNILQMNRLLTILAAECCGSTITAAMVSATLSREDRAASTGSITGLDLSGTLEDITFRVVQSVLQEENMNRSRTARRLGISRATVWRILGKDE